MGSNSPLKTRRSSAVELYFIHPPFVVHANCLVPLNANLFEGGLNLATRFLVILAVTRTDLQLSTIKYGWSLFGK